jgi:hypothetical protein
MKPERIPEYIAAIDYQEKSIMEPTVNTKEKKEHPLR